ncbi:hypothetical protein ACIRBY_24970 [Streptomyces sp. NPDC096136]|uniref:hypothetical protein n=1 Tax=Streptomyces sp. NPDC096136 TaxID=3366076 RepID=UPI00380E33EA
MVFADEGEQGIHSYILTNSTSGTIKIGGYWSDTNATFNYNDDNDSYFWPRVKCSKANVKVTL